MYSHRLLKTSLAGAITLAFASLAFTALAAKPAAPAQMTPPRKTKAMMHKMHYAPCYGINAAYKNDCVSPGHSCAGQDPKARDANAFVAVPAGLCTKIAGGSLKAG